MLSIRNLSAGYFKEYVIRDISIDIDNNLFVGVIGKNGSGKSTFMKAILRLVDILKGEVLIDGKRVIGDEIYRLFSYVPQENFINFDFSVYEILKMSQPSYQDFFGTLSVEEKRRIEEIIEIFDLGPLLKRSILNLSGGERRRVMIGRGLSQPSDIVLLDEPLSGLDIEHQVKVFKRISEMSHKGRIIIASIHDLNLAAQFCDRIILMDEGRLIKYGLIEEVMTYNNIKTAFGVDVYVGVNEINNKRFLIPFN